MAGIPVYHLPWPHYLDAGTLVLQTDHRFKIHFYHFLIIWGMSDELKVAKRSLVLLSLRTGDYPTPKSRQASK